MKPAPRKTNEAWWLRLAGRGLDLLYPPVCDRCGEPLSHNRWLCDPCGAQLRRITPPFCKICGEGFPGNLEGPFTCPNCRGQAFAFDFARAALDGGREETRSLVHALKYQRRLYLGRDLAGLMAEAFLDPRLAPALAEKWPLVPVPLHRRRQGSRQFNQAEELAHHLGRQLELPVVRALRRVRPTPTQTLLSRKRRLANLSDAFLPSRAAGRLGAGPVILLDDVFTTGATAHECAKVLKRGTAANKVVVLTLLRS